MIIIGAGMAGLLAGVLNPSAEIWEAKSSLPQEHKAVFRLQSDAIAKFTGISMKKVKVHKGIWFEGKDAHKSIRLANLYSQKVTGQVSARSILDLDSVSRWIPPINFTEQMADLCKKRILFGREFVKPEGEPIISTIPLPAMMSILGLKMAKQVSAEGIWITQIHIKNCNTYSTIYYPGTEMAAYRASITGDTLIVESTDHIDAQERIQIFESFGILQEAQIITQNHCQPRGKIVAMDSAIRKSAITQMTLNHNIYSLGRYATWRPKVMLDDVLEDIFVIKRLVEEGNYAAKLHQQEN